MKKLLIFCFLITTIIILNSCNNISQSDNVTTNQEKEVITIKADYSIYDSSYMINNCDNIVSGKVKLISDNFVLFDKSKASEEDKKKYGTVNDPFTIFEVTVTETYKGNFVNGDKFLLAMPYGENENYIVESDSFPRLDINKEYLLFISCLTELDGIKYYSIKLPLQGCIPVDLYNSNYDNYVTLTHSFSDCSSYDDIINIIKSKVNN